MKVNFVFPHSIDTIGGAEKMTIFAMNYLQDKGVTIIKSEHDPDYDEDPDLVVFISRQYDHIKRCLNNCIPTALIGYYSFYHTFSHVLKDKSQIEHIKEFTDMINNPYFTFICMTENDYNIAKMTCPHGHFILGTNIMPEVSENHTYGSDALMCARLCEQKNNVAVKEIAELLPDIEFKLTDTVDVDERWYQESCHKKLADTNNVKFLKPSSNVMEVPAYWDNNLCLILTSWYETMPLVIGEALSKGIPVIMYDVVTPDIQYFKNVFVVPQGYYKDFAKIIKSLKEHGVDHYNVMCAYHEDRKLYEDLFPHIGKAIYRLAKEIK